MLDLETLFHCESKVDTYQCEFADSKTPKNSASSRERKVNQLIAGVDFRDTDVVKFTNANSNYGAIIMTYKGKQYSFHSRSRSNRYTSFWRCRRKEKLKCPGRLHFSSKTNTVLKELPHNDSDHNERLKVSTMGTDDQVIRYSKSLQKKTVLHYQGYHYVQDKKQPYGKVRWFCRYQPQKKCQGYLHTKDGFLYGDVREHNHLPQDLPPVGRSEGNRMISSLFL